MDFICSKCLSHYLPVVVPYWLTLMSRTIQVSSNTFSASSAVSVSWRSSNSNWVWPGHVWKVKSGSSFHAPYFILLRGKQFRGPAFSGMPLIRMHHEVGARLQTKDWNSLIFTEPQQKCCDFAMDRQCGIKTTKMIKNEALDPESEFSHFGSWFHFPSLEILEFVDAKIRCRCVLPQSPKKSRLRQLNAA